VRFDLCRLFIPLSTRCPQPADTHNTLSRQVAHKNTFSVAKSLIEIQRVVFSINSGLSPKMMEFTSVSCGFPVHGFAPTPTLFYRIDSSAYPQVVDLFPAPVSTAQPPYRKQNDKPDALDKQHCRDLVRDPARHSHPHSRCILFTTWMINKRWLGAKRELSTHPLWKDFFTRPSPKCLSANGYRREPRG